MALSGPVSFTSGPERLRPGLRLRFDGGRAGAVLAASTSRMTSSTVRARRWRRGSALSLAFGMRSKGFSAIVLAEFTHQLQKDTIAV